MSALLFNKPEEPHPAKAMLCLPAPNPQVPRFSRGDKGEGCGLLRERDALGLQCKCLALQYQCVPLH
jgi:hypothetical protein